MVGLPPTAPGDHPALNRLAGAGDGLKINRVLFTNDELRCLYQEQRLSVAAIAARKGCHQSVVGRYLTLYGIARRSGPAPRIRYPRRSFSGDLIAKAYLLGFRAGDLHVHKANHSDSSQTIVVACTSTMSEQIELVATLFEEYGRVNVSVGVKQSVITSWLDLSFSFLLKKTDEVASWILSDEPCFSAYLAGYIDAEGCIHIKRCTHAAEVMIRSYDVNILRTCQTKLLTLGVECPPVHLVKRRGERDGNGPLYHHDYWSLGIYRRSSLVRLFSMISPYMRHPKRRRDMLAAWENMETRLHLRGNTNVKVS